MDLISELEVRKLISSTTNPGPLRDLLREGGPKIVAYAGFDPTGPSLHVGHLLPILLLRRIQAVGGKVIALVGGATGLIGDPSGKSTERPLADPSVVEANVNAITKQLQGLIPEVTVVNNAEWFRGMGTLDFLRDVGKHFSVNEMLKRDSVSKRLGERDQGISFTEFSYGLLQAYDFVALWDRFGCNLQVGGSDQWGNIVSGIDLLRRMRGVEGFGMTTPLLTDSKGVKFGKTEKGAVWLDPELMSPYEFFQFWVNTADEDVERFHYLFNHERSLAELNESFAPTNSDPEVTSWRKRFLGQLVTGMIHGKREARCAEVTSGILFGPRDYMHQLPEEREYFFHHAPGVTLTKDQLGSESAKVTGLLASPGGPCTSKSEARRVLQQGGVTINDIQCDDPQKVLTLEDVNRWGVIVLRKGKKGYFVVRVE